MAFQKIFLYALTTFLLRFMCSQLKGKIKKIKKCALSRKSKNSVFNKLFLFFTCKTVFLNSCLSPNTIICYKLFRTVQHLPKC